jgi:hypothetical protein
MGLQVRCKSPKRVIDHPSWPVSTEFGNQKKVTCCSSENSSVCVTRQLAFVMEVRERITNADVNISLISLTSLGAELKKMRNSNDSSFIKMSIPHNRSL